MRFFTAFNIVLFTINIAFSQSKKLSPDEFQAELRKQNIPQLLDIRSASSFANGHIKKAYNMDITDGDFEAYINQKFNKNQPLFVYCQSGNQSQNASIFFHERGFNHVYILDGGFENWIVKSKPYTSSSEVSKPMAVFTEANYIKLIAQNKIVVVVFTKNNCTPCQDILQKSYKIQAENKDVSVLKIDEEINKTLSEKFEIVELPTLIMYKNGKQIWRQSLDIEESEIKAMLN